MNMKSHRFSAVALAAALALVLSPGAAHAACEPGAYRAEDGDFVVVTNSRNSSQPGQRYVFRDGRRGGVDDAGGLVSCAGNAAVIRAAGGEARWPRVAFAVTPTTFESAETALAGQLIEPPGPAGSHRPLVILVHGSEQTAAIGSQLPYVLAAQGLSVFV